MISSYTKKQIIADYNNGNGLSNMELARKHGCTPGTIRRKLIEAGVYQAQRALYNSALKTDRSAAWQLVHAERLLKVAAQTTGDINLYNEISNYFNNKNQKRHGNFKGIPKCNRYGYRIFCNPVFFSYTNQSQGQEES